MIDTSQTAEHLDAEQLAAFAEGVLPQYERLQVLKHLEGCPHCREIVFLAQEAAPVEALAPAPIPNSAPWWRAWSHPWLLGGAAALAASMLLLGVFLWKRPALTGNDVSTVASNREQAMPPPLPFPAARASQSSPENAAALPRAAAKAAPRPPVAVPDQRPALAQSAEQAVAAAPQAPAKQPPVGGFVAMAPPPTAGANAAAPLPPRAVAQGQLAPAPSSKPSAASASPGSLDALSDDASVTVNAARRQQLPLMGRSASALAAPKMNLSTGGPLRLQIEHGSGPSDGNAQLSGMVVDPAGAAIPGATVTLLGPALGVSTKTVTDGSGHFALLDVPAGQYQAEIASRGFVTVTQRLNLQPRDVARAETVLNVGAVSETVEVSAANAEVAAANAPLSTAEVAPAKGSRGDDALPGGHVAATTVSIGDLAVALDAAGNLFVRRESKHWKKVKPLWPDEAKTLESAAPDPAAKYAKKAGSQVFQITTSAGAIWSSADGEHWIQR